MKDEDMAEFDSELRQAGRMIIHAQGHVFQALFPVSDPYFDVDLTDEQKVEIKTHLETIQGGLKEHEALITKIYSIINKE